MREYAVFSPTFWTGPTGRRIRAQGRDAQCVAAYLFTSPHSTMTGLYSLPIAYLMHDVGIDEEGAREALRRLSEVGFASYDEETETIWVPEMASYQVGVELKPKDNRIAAVVRDAEKMRKSPFFSAFVERYRAPYHLTIATNVEGVGSPSEAPSKPLRSQDQDQEQDQDQRGGTRERAEAPPIEPPPVHRGDLCEAMRVAYVERFERTLPGKRVPMPARGPGNPVWDELSRIAVDLPGFIALLDAAFADSFVRGAGFTPGAIRGAADRLLAVGPRAEPTGNARASPPRGVAPPASHAVHAAAVRKAGGNDGIAEETL